MSDLEARLGALLREERPPARDALFRLAVLERLARRRLQARIAVLIVVGVAATAALAALSPSLAPEIQSLSADETLPGAGLALAILTTVWAMLQLRRPI